MVLESHSIDFCILIRARFSSIDQHLRAHFSEFVLSKHVDAFVTTGVLIAITNVFPVEVVVDFWLCFMCWNLGCAAAFGKWR